MSATKASKIVMETKSQKPLSSEAVAGEADAAAASVEERPYEAKTLQADLPPGGPAAQPAGDGPPSQAQPDEERLAGIMPRRIESLLGRTWDENLDFSEGNPLERGSPYERLLRRLAISPGLLLVVALALTLLNRLLFGGYVATPLLVIAVIAFLVITARAFRDRQKQKS